MPDPAPKYPQISVTLVGEDGNSMVLLAKVTRVMREAKLPKDEIDRFVNEATKSDYVEMLATIRRWVVIT